MELDPLHSKIRDLFVKELKSGEVEEEIDVLLNSHDSDICSQCGYLFCAYKDPLHFHHDGCPCCSFARPWEKLTYRSRLLKRLTTE